MAKSTRTNASVLQDKYRCTGCSLCREVCPRNCIEMREERDGFSYPHINLQECIDCGKCEKMCPVISPREKITPISAYAYRDKDLDSRLKSASGGVAARFGEVVLKEGGIYTGVRLDENFRAVHDLCETREELDLFRDSKYVQSELNGLFRKVKEKLEQGKVVFVTGMPCQIAAIRSYLQKDYENLYLCDLICNGFDSPLVFRKYIEQIETENHKKVKRFYFRDKSNGWRKSNIRVMFADDSERIILRGESDFYRLFELALRKSCNDCQFRCFSSGSDITIGDYWGIEKRYPDYDDGAGCSVVITNTRKGQAFFEKLKSAGDIIETGVEYALETHRKLTVSVPANKYHDLFFKDLGSKGLRKATWFYTSTDCKVILIRRRLKWYLWRILKKFV